MGNIYVLQGRGNCGKTETINFVYQILVNKYKLSQTQIQNFFPNAPDIKIIMSGVNGKKIGIESQGDPNSRLEQSLKDFVNAGCDIIFCACRTSGMTVRWINSHKPKYTPLFIKQTIVVPAQQKQNNHNMAQQLISQAGL